MRKKWLAFLLSMAMALTVAPAWADEESHVSLIVNDRLYTAEDMIETPVIIDSRAYVPLRIVSESLGYRVDWVANTRLVRIDDDYTVERADVIRETVADDAPVTLQIMGDKVTSPADMGTPYISPNGVTMVPVRLVMESLNCSVSWMEGLVVVAENKPEPPAEEPKEETPVKENPSTETTEEPEEEPVVEHHWYDTLTIQGANILTADELNAYLKDMEPTVRKRMETLYPDRGFTPYPENIAELYIQIGKKYNIRGDLAFAQAVKETGYFQFTGQVEYWQNNYCGLWATGVALTGEEPLNGVDPQKAVFIPETHGVTYLEVAYGVEAHIQHLYAYSSKNALPAGCEKLDPRFSYVSRGVAPYWIDLGGKWAVPGVGYGNSIIEDYWMPANKSNKLVGELTPVE